MKCIIYSVRIIKQNSISVDIVGKLQTAIGIMHAQFRPDILYLYLWDKFYTFRILFVATSEYIPCVCVLHHLMKPCSVQYITKATVRLASAVYDSKLEQLKHHGDGNSILTSHLRFFVCPWVEQTEPAQYCCRQSFCRICHLEK